MPHKFEFTTSKNLIKIFLFHILSILALELSHCPTLHADSRPHSLLLSESPFQPATLDDRDLDCLSDEAEHRIAMHFRPLFIFDSRERARLPSEPVVLYQVTTGIDARRTECGPVPRTVTIRYAHLYRDDGGFSTSNVCRNSHFGDNQTIHFEISVSADGKTFSLSRVFANFDRWPGTNSSFFKNQNLVVFLSAGKHHEYLNTSRDNTGYRFFFGCNEGVNGRGARVLSVVESPIAPRGWHNVGERHSHPDDVFVGDLTAFGFRGENAWGRTPFCGGHLGQCLKSHQTDSMSGQWLPPVR